MGIKFMFYFLFPFRWISKKFSFGNGFLKALYGLYENKYRKTFQKEMDLKSKGKDFSLKHILYQIRKNAILSWNCLPF